jgi:toxin ParE1/3/4
MTKYKIEITRTAKNDLAGISNYIAKELMEPKIAEKLVDKIGSEVFTLEKMPLRGPLVLDERLKQLGIRRIFIENYIVLYIVNAEKKTVQVLRILYNKRNWEALL